MTNIENIKKFKDQLFESAKKAGFTDYEIYFPRSENFEAYILDQEVRDYKIYSPSGLSFRGTYDGKMGYAYTEKIDTEIIDFLVNNAKNNAIIKETNDEVLFSGSESYAKSLGISPELEKIDATQKIEWAKQMEAHAKELDPRIVAVDYCVIGSNTGFLYISNSHQLDLYDEYGSAMAYISVRAVENNETKTGSKMWAARDFSDFDPKYMAQEAVTEATKKLGSSSIKTGDYSILIENKTMGNLLSAFLSNFFAENTQKGLSLLKDKLDTQIATPKLTIRDNINHEKSLKHSIFDSEGVAIQDKTIIENGILKMFLYNIKSANKENKKTTGNGFKAGFKATVATNINNFFIEPGDLSFDQLTKDFSGVLVTGFMGLHAGTNSVSGDFSLQANGFLYENGKIIKPVEQITIAGNFYNLLKNIEQIGNDIYFSPMGGGIGSPTLAINSLKISGE